MRNNNSNFLFRIIGAFCLIIFVACESEKRPEQVAELPQIISFTEHVNPIFEGKGVGIEISGKGKDCTSCHSGGSIPPDLTAENAYLNLTGSGYLDLDIPESSKLYVKIAPGGSMYRYTNDIDVEFILEWIKQGALDN